jgi:flagellar hook protein FlgE
MSLYGAMMTGVAGLGANSQALSVASSNIANVNTVGYKSASTQFSTLLASAAGTSDPSSASVTAQALQNVTQQGLPTSTNSPTDLAISGNGFFVVCQSPTATSNVAYTRAGSFSADASGNLKNAAGFYLLGWALDTSGNAPTNPNSLSLINVNNLSGRAVASTSISMQANLQASGAEAPATYDPTDAAHNMAGGIVTPDFQHTFNVVDSQGGTQPLEFSFIKSGANTWKYEVTYQGDTDNLTDTNPIAYGTLTFNSDGSLASATSNDGTAQDAGLAAGSIDISIPFDVTTSGLEPQKLAIDFGTIDGTDGITQYDTNSQLTTQNIDGAAFGNVTSLSIGTDGTVTANFSNGLSQSVFKVPLATFTNPNKLAGMTGNAYQATPDSGVAILNAANSGGAGSINQKQLEGSTVDLATEFTNLITAQRAYSASSKIVTTASEMLDQLLQMTR